MKKNRFAAFLAFLFLGFATFNPNAVAATALGLAASPQGSPLKTIQGTVKADGDKISLIADEDGKSWMVMNPDTLKSHVGHHVEINAHFYADKNAVHVLSVKMVNK